MGMLAGSLVLVVAAWAGAATVAESTLVKLIKPPSAAVYKGELDEMKAGDFLGGEQILLPRQGKVRSLVKI